MALLGLGTVGSGVYKIFERHKEDFFLKTRVNVNLKTILERDDSKIKALGVSGDRVASDFKEIISNPDIDIVVEVIGGIEPAKTFILEAIKAGKHIVTANKELLSCFGKEILESARDKNVDVFFEASVGGGIPIIHPLKEYLVGNKILRVMGIVNGTTNYILTKMADDNCPYEVALKEAQEKGFAERDPSADVEGRDAAAKIAILASIAFNSRVTVENVFVEGITSITPQDIMYARELGYVIKLITLAKEENGEIDVRVHPTMISSEHPLASVKGVNNAIFVEGDAVGEVMFYGPGAGSLPAASAVVGDILGIASNICFGGVGKIGCTCFEAKRIKPIDEINSSFYLLMDVIDKPGVLARIAKIFGENNVSLASVIQKGPRGTNAELMFITHQTKESNLRKALSEIKELNVVNKICNVIRVEES